MFMIWDSQFEPLITKLISQINVEYLKIIFPKTWIVGEEKHFTLGMLNDVSTSIDIVKLSRKNRQYVIKPSSFSNNSSWAEGVTLLDEKSAQKASKIISKAQQDSSHLTIMQEFHEGEKRQM